MSFIVDLFTGGGGSNKAANAARQREDDRERRIAEGRASIDAALAPLNQGFFDQTREAQLNFNVPQIDQQFEDAQRNLAFSLARIGQLNSSVAAEREGRLAAQREEAFAEANRIANEAAQNQQRAVEDERRSLIGQLEATADPTTAASAARGAADVLRQGQTLRDLEPLFTNVTAGIAQTTQPRFDANGNVVANPISSVLSKALSGGRSGNPGSSRIVQ